MAKLWTANKTWQGNTTPVAGTKYLVGAASGKCSYQTFSAGQTKRCLVSNGANGNIAYQNVTMPLPDMMGTVNMPLLSDIYMIAPVPIRENVGGRAYITSAGSGLQMYITAWDATNKRYEIDYNSSQSASSAFMNIYIKDRKDALIDKYDSVIKSIKYFETWTLKSGSWLNNCKQTVTSVNNISDDYGDGWKLNYTPEFYVEDDWSPTLPTKSRLMFFN